MVVFVYILLCLIWGSTWIAIKLGLSDAPPLYAAGIRFSLAVLILWSIMYFRKLRPPSTLRELASRAYPGVFMYGTSYALVYLSEQYISSALTAVLFGAFPFFVALLSKWKFRNVPISKIGWLGLMLGFAGVVLISWDSLKQSHAIFGGVLMTLTATFASAYGLMIHKRDHAHKEIVTSAAVQMTAGALILLLAAIAFEDFSNFAFTPQSIGSILYLTFMGTITAFLGYYWLLGKVKVLTASLIPFVTPMVAIFIGFGFFGETLTTQTMIGAGMILSGITLVLRK
ncbi:MAG: EamA family transporter [candidate division Zixibacteria bacterium]|nr:EamA family transporter [candidate division Zixibacteria bacterium]